MVKQTINLSPHVTIYKFPITAISSIATRISGVYLSGIFVGYGISRGIGLDIDGRYKQLTGYTKSMVDYSLVAPLTYHSLSGIRHFVWDKYPSLLNNNHVAKSSYLLFGTSIGTTIMIERYLNSKSQE